MVSPLSRGAPPVTRRTGLPQVWPSRQENECTDIVIVIFWTASVPLAHGNERARCARSVRGSSCSDEALDLAFGLEPDDPLLFDERLAFAGEALPVAAMRLPGPQQDRLA